MCHPTYSSKDESVQLDEYDVDKYLMDDIHSSKYVVTTVFLNRSSVTNYIHTKSLKIVIHVIRGVYVWSINEGLDGIYHELGPGPCKGEGVSPSCQNK